MKTQTIILALLLTVGIMSAQEEKKQTTVRVKKIEKVNGVEKVSDTSYTVQGPLNVHSIESEAFSSEGKAKTMVIVTDEVHGDNVRLIKSDDEINAQIEAALKAAGVDGKELSLDKIMVLDSDLKEGKDGDKKMTKVVIVKTVKLVEASEEDTKLLGKQTGIIDNKLPVNEMKFYPNPNTGKFNLDFALNTKGTTDIQILNIEGKSVYNEQLKDFSGHYSKEIDISSNPKGVYFVKISQGTHSQLKKLVMD